MAKPELTGNASDHLKLGVGSAGRGDLEAVAHLLSLKPGWLSRRGSHGRSMIWEAAYRGRLEVVRYLVKAGADIHAYGGHYTPMRGLELSPHGAALFKRHAAVVEELVERGAEYEIHTAAYIGDLDRVRELVEMNPELLEAAAPLHPAEQHFPSATPLCYALAWQHMPVILYLLERGAVVEPHSGDFLDRAAENVALLQLLLDHGADPGALEAPLSTDPEVVAFYARHGKQADPNETDDGWPALVYIVRGDRGGNPDEVRELLEQGADVHIRNYKGKTALHVGAKAGFVPALEILLEHGADPNAADPTGETPLHEVVRSTIKRVERRVGVVELLLAHGADPTIENQSGESPLDLARRSRRDDTSRLADLLVAAAGAR